MGRFKVAIYDLKDWARPASQIPALRVHGAWGDLNSPRAVEVSIYVVRAFVQLRNLLAGHKQLSKRLDELETRMERKLMTQEEGIENQSGREVRTALRGTAIRCLNPPRSARNAFYVNFAPLRTPGGGDRSKFSSKLKLSRSRRRLW